MGLDVKIWVTLDTRDALYYTGGMYRLFGLSLPLILLDQVSKYLVLDSGVASICNAGVAWGSVALPLWANVALTAVALLLGALLAWPTLERASVRLVAALGWVLILTGGVSNLLDKAVRGCVVDFLPLPLVPNFPWYNVADIYLTLGVVLLIGSEIVYNRKAKSVNSELLGEKVAKNIEIK